MKNEEILEYIKEMKSDFHKSMDKLGVYLSDLNEKFIEHASSGSKYRFQVDSNKNNIEKLKESFDGTIPTVLNFIDKVSSTNSQIDKINEHIEKIKNEISSIKKINLFFDSLLKHPKIIILLISFIYLIIFSLKEIPLKIF